MKKRVIFTLAAVCALLLAARSGEPAGFPAREYVAAMTNEAATEALAGTSEEALREAWGEPDGMLSGLYGDVYEVKGKYIVVYYDVRPNGGVQVQAVHIGTW